MLRQTQPLRHDLGQPTSWVSNREEESYHSRSEVPKFRRWGLGWHLGIWHPNYSLTGKEGPLSLDFLHGVIYGKHLSFLESGALVHAKQTMPK